jgi:hypothetical protein
LDVGHANRDGYKEGYLIKGEEAIMDIAIYEGTPSEVEKNVQAFLDSGAKKEIHFIGQSESASLKSTVDFMQPHVTISIWYTERKVAKRARTVA